ncbi:hypothetical protein HOE67_04705 [Candidatus Peregrinibacteria bacterium]|jgi:hypothetical protein|nr:hypothetical protein [Candidatus Peregrinibacteria bacterium]MBT4056382.1 hypothetical protein [Candidatus Peregrinibacteria bacterium]
MTTSQQLEKEIKRIKARNKRVELDKAWETSWTRRILTLTLTYLIILVFFLVAKLEDPYVNATIPALAFVTGTSSIPHFKKFWTRYINKKR